MTPRVDTTPLPPIVRSITVQWDPETAFNRFTAQFAQWWPWHTHSIGETRVKRIVFETHAGGRIYEEHHDGRRFQWGRITTWNPPRSVGFTWHPSRPEATAQDVVIEFMPQDTGTLVRLTATGWERWGMGAARARKGYSMGWNNVLNVWAGKRTGTEPLIRILVCVAQVVQFFRGGLDASINRAGGEIPADEAGPSLTHAR